METPRRASLYPGVRAHVQTPCGNDLGQEEGGWTHLFTIGLQGCCSLRHRPTIRENQGQQNAVQKGDKRKQQTGCLLIYEFCR